MGSIPIICDLVRRNRVSFAAASTVLAEHGLWLEEVPTGLLCWDRRGRVIHREMSFQQGSV